MLSQELVDHLRYGTGVALTDWFIDNPVINKFVTCPATTIRPKAIPHARRISVFDRKVGRYADIAYNDGSHRYLMQVDDQCFSVEAVASLINKVEAVFGHCHVEKKFLVIYVPAGYFLKIFDDALTRVELVIDLNGDLANI